MAKHLGQHNRILLLCSHNNLTHEHYFHVIYPFIILGYVYARHNNDTEDPLDLSTQL